MPSHSHRAILQVAEKTKEFAAEVTRYKLSALYASTFQRKWQ